MGTRVVKICRHTKLTRETSLRAEIYSTRNIDAKRNVRVRFLLPENTKVDQRKEIEVFPDNPEEDSTLPAICELMIFSSQGMDTPKTPKQKPVLPKAFVHKANEDLSRPKRDYQSSVVKLPPATPKCSTQELKIANNNNNSMRPEDYKDPSQSDTRRRILAWLDDAERARPTYRRRFNTFST